ncbi:amiloride-sensitive sodium channel subunit beta-2-like [Acanthaster planci]|uniref:Amiloride-sensitive sodium channel subunit beta-2-like n=1 Tax=Acanthaster planci TaxID=133434 RepID=A0A8B7ZYD7_ACAPL|nr:amiloride-sensitive sodium channel subunit beta-2-like [Acanthaster planci]
MRASEKPADTPRFVCSVLERIGAHGIPNIGRAGTRQRRLAWTGLVLAGLGFLVWQGTLLVTRYLQYDVKVSVGLGYEALTTFPAVTVCNLNRIPRTAMHTNSKLAELEGYIEYILETQVYQAWNDEMRYTNQVADFGITTESFDIMADIPYANRSSAGHQLSRMLLYCTFNGYPCSPLNFTHFYNYFYGNCYTFNFDSRLARRVAQAGPFYGLTMELFVEQTEYVRGLQNSAGLKVFISGQNQVPFPEDRGIIVSPGRETSIALHKVRIDRLGAPYTSCTSDLPTIFSTFYGNVDYSLLACEKSCVAQEILEMCHCADPRYRFTDETSSCSSQNQSQMACTRKILLAYVNNSLRCNCPLPCSEVEFEETVSAASWPNENYKFALENIITRLSADFSSAIEEDDRFIEKNVVKLNVFLSSLQYQYIYQTPDYSQENLISDLGGQVGLWMGFSILTFFEIAELVLDLFVYTRGKSANRVSREAKVGEGLVGMSLSPSVNTLTPIG